ncbi:response regulator transcription factor [Paenibacillus donghaensis]|uniref:response regulator transcription factor n=1 Tax=Paenibacillus donghaensis TaxID=414771 RepID=UPI00188449C3|nr:response regulator transcription factor [Paenibacillus donghaensis]MBE9914039.1 response regulator transcription factor [Paenibacillus donghaensis]
MRKQKVFIVEDEAPIAELLAYNLEKEGYVVASTGKGEEALELIRANRPDLILLDLMLPDMSGFDICRIASTENWNVPIIMLTAKSDIVDKLLGMELGADDYVTKPFDIREVIVRIKAIFRRIEQVMGQSDLDGEGMIRIYDSIEIGKRQREVKKEGEKVVLKNMEFDLLLFLAEHRGIVFTRSQLLDQVWGYEFAGDTRTVDIHVQRLRKKLDAAVIDTVFGVGYRMP